MSSFTPGIQISGYNYEKYNTYIFGLEITEVEGYRAGPDSLLAQHNGGRGVLVYTAMEAWKGGPYRLPCPYSTVKTKASRQKYHYLCVCVCASADGSWKGRIILGW
jgi:hypothetical protein